MSHGISGRSDIIRDNKYYRKNQVNDFHLKKEGVFTVTTEALQEVDRQLQAEKVKTATLETTVSSQQTTINDLVARIAALENA